MFNKPSNKLIICSFTIVFFAINVFGQDTKILLQKAETAMGNNKFEDAIQTLNIVISREPNNENALTLRSRSYILTQKVAEASADAEKVLVMNPKNLFALNVRGMVKGANKDYKGAFEEFTKAVTFDPTFYRSYYQRARIRMFSGENLSNILSDFDLAIKYSNEDLGILQTAGNACLEKEGSTEICSAYFSTYKLKKPDSALGYLGYALAFANNFAKISDKSIFEKEVIPNFRKAIELNAKDEIAPLNLGRLYLKLGNNSESIIWLTKASELNPKRAWTFAMLGESYANKKEFGRAISNYDKAIELDPKYDIAIKQRQKAQAAINNNAGASNSSANLTLEGARLALIALVERELNWRNRSDEFNTKYQRTFLDRVGGLTAQEKTQIAGLKKEGEDLVAAYKNYNTQYQTILQNSSNGRGFQDSANKNIAGINESLGLMNRMFPGVPPASPSNTINDARIALIALVEKELDWHKRTGDFNKKYQAGFLDRVGGLTPAERTELNGYKKEGDALIVAYKNYNTQYQSLLQSSNDGKKFQDSAIESINSINKMLGFINRLLGS